MTTKRRSRQSIVQIRAGFPRLLISHEPWVFKAVCDGADLASALSDWQRGHPSIRLFILDGSRMRTSNAFYDEFQSRLSLPGYFGRNLNALTDCLRDVEIMKGGGFVILLNNGSQLLIEEPIEMLEGTLDTLKWSGAGWAIPVTDGEVWDRPAAPFHTIVQCDECSPILAALPSLLA